jgi:3-oxoacyl-[acyl-carrier protein] reductase
MSGARKTLLLFGASGSIGSAIGRKFKEQSWEVIGVSRSELSAGTQIRWNPLDRNSPAPLEQLRTYEGFDAICWAQGKNCNDSIYEFDEQLHRDVYEANVIYILKSLSVLLENEWLKKPAKLCVISSIWQNLSRQNKLSYGVSKAALQGLILSVANDIGADGHLINAILPGALDTPMTHKNLTKEQMDVVVNSTQFGRLANLNDVANTAYFLCSSENTGVTGQFIKVDLGYSDVRII